jgi:hypothetical protein
MTPQERTIKVTTTMHRLCTDAQAQRILNDIKAMDHIPDAELDELPFTNPDEFDYHAMKIDDYDDLPVEFGGLMK